MSCDQFFVCAGAPPTPWLHAGLPAGRQGFSAFNYEYGESHKSQTRNRRLEHPKNFLARYLWARPRSPVMSLLREKTKPSIWRPSKKAPRADRASITMQ